MTYLAVIGSAFCDSTVAGLARELGREIARQGSVLVCGGRGGVMEAACQGAQDQGGTTVGILPGKDRSEANPYVDVAIVTGLGEARNAIVVRSADAVIAVRGGHGTLSEIGLALKMGKPVVGLSTWQLLQPDSEVDWIVRAKSPVEAVSKALALAGSEPAQEATGG